MSAPLLVLVGWGVGPRVDHPEGELLFAQARAWALKRGVPAAADWLEAAGIPRELALYALVGSHRAIQYGAPAVDCSRKALKEADAI